MFLFVRDGNNSTMNETIQIIKASSLENANFTFPEPEGCFNFMLVGQPRFIDIFTNPTPDFVVRFSFATLSVIVSFFLCVFELKSIMRYDDRFLLRLTQILATLHMGGKLRSKPVELTILQKSVIFKRNLSQKF